MTQDAILEGVSRGIARTLVDGTVRVTIDIEPRFAMLAMAVLGMPGNPVAVARLGAMNTPERKPEPASSRPNGPICHSAVILCNEQKFQDFCKTHLDVKPGESARASARRMILDYCGVESRRDLDTDPVAAMAFKQLMSEYRTFLGVS